MTYTKMINGKSLWIIENVDVDCSASFTVSCAESKTPSVASQAEKQGAWAVAHMKKVEVPTMAGWRH